MPRAALALWFFLLGLPALAAGEPTRLSWDIELQTLTGTLPSEDARLLLERLDRPDTPRIELVARARQSVELPTDSRWVIDFVIPGFWGPRTEIEVTAGAPRSWVFNLRPAGKVAGSLTTRQGPLPKTLDLFGDLPGGLRPMSRCVIEDKGSFECPLPAGSNNLVVAAGAFAPVRFRDARIEAGKTLKLPATDLLPGASLVGRVVLDDDSPPGVSPATTIRLLRFTTVAPRDLEPPRPIVETVLPADGHFSFVGLEPTVVVLEVTKPGYAPSRLAPLELIAGIELALPEPLRLVLPLDVVVEVDPSTDGFGRPWSVGLSRPETRTGDRSHPTTFEGVTNGEGRLRLPGLETGRYFFRIEDEAGNRFHFDPELWISGPADSVIHVQLPLIEVRGEVTLGDRPLPARLLFGGRFGTHRMEAETDEEGRYSVTLPRPGRWRVDLEAESVTTRLTVEVEAGLDKRRARLDLRVPDTQLFGTVVDENGGPVAGAEVLGERRDEHWQFKTDAEGRFEGRGVAPGPLAISAQVRTARPVALASDEVRRELVEGQPAGPIELRLYPLALREGRVLRPGGQPVPGAAVTVWSRSGRPTVGQAQTDDEGRFSVRVDPRSTRFDLLVMAPGAALTVTSQPNGENPLEVVVEGEGGELQISWPFDSEDFRKRGFDLRIFHGDTELGLPYVHRWRRALALPTDPEMSERRIAIPRLAPGNYLACLGRADALAAAMVTGLPAAAPGVTCKGGHLVAGGRLALRLLAPPG